MDVIARCLAPKKMLHARRAAVRRSGGMLLSRRFSCRVCSHAFTLIELLVVISIIIVLIGLALPAFQGVQNSAKKTQAKNDLVQLVTAVNAFYTEYGRYPTAATTDAQAKYGPGGVAGNKVPLDELRGVAKTNPVINTRQVVFISPPESKDQTSPRSGIKTADGEWYDTWGKPYAVAIDADYDNFVANPYSANAGTTTNATGTLAVQTGVIGWSLGKNGIGGSGDKNGSDARDDVLSWQ